MIVPLLLGIVVGIFVYSSSADDAIANVIIRVSSLAVNIVFAILANGIYKKRIDKLVNTSEALLKNAGVNITLNMKPLSAV